MGIEVLVYKRTFQYCGIALPFLYLGSQFVYLYMDPVGEIRRREQAFKVPSSVSIASFNPCALQHSYF